MTAMGAALLVMTGSGAWAQQDPKDVYLNKCATCHGPDGGAKTAMGKKLKIKGIRDVAGSVNADAMINIVTNGKGQDMDAFGKQLSKDLIKGLVEYYRSLAK